MNGYVVLALVLTLVAVVVFFVLREFWTWYWKQSEQVELLKDIKASLERLEAKPTTTWRSPSGWSPAPSIPEPLPKSLLDKLADRVG